MENIIDFNSIQQIARKAGAVQLEYLGKLKSIEYKNVRGKNDIVTEVDTVCEEIIISEINNKFPDHDILAEEGGFLDGKSSRYRWLIDPLDGTMNYTHSYPFFCISIALEDNGEIVYGLVFDPFKDELFTALKGKGSQLNGNEISVSEADKLDESLVVSGTFYYEDKERMEKFYSILNRVTHKVRGVRRDGSAALDLCYVACGRYEAFWEYGLNPWDVAAGSLIVKEAGGTVTDFSANRFTVYEKELLATNSKVHKELCDLIY